MESLKKHLEIYKINRQIRSLNREAFDDASGQFHYVGHVPYQKHQGFHRPSEKSEIIRRVINELTEKREAIRRA